MMIEDHYIFFLQTFSIILHFSNVFYSHGISIVQEMITPISTSCTRIYVCNLVTIFVTT